MEIIRGQLSPMYVQHEAIEAQKAMVNSPNHTVVSTSRWTRWARPLTATGTFSATEANVDYVMRNAEPQKIASVLTGNPVPPVTGTGAIVIMNSQRLSLEAAVQRHQPTLVDDEHLVTKLHGLRPTGASR